MSRSTARILSTVCVIAVILTFFLMALSGNETGAIIAFLIYLPIDIYLSYCQRCRHCGRWPRRSEFWIKYCPRCGKKL